MACTLSSTVAICVFSYLLLFGAVHLGTANNKLMRLTEITLLLLPKAGVALLFF